ncbi:hypothetical protein P389DRAFT_170682 [Cystobasidium minutum MCA 4210]|uniref:uncharacterized protein n=1 Tax=Cystobasidium minutum MCA 4210 TaxID=1397322 RepID=UPI0034CF034B|eukprot:jgi/Rhomi1/170682/fgenesh1_kg.4_\
MAHSATEKIGIKVVNVLVFLFFFSSHMYSVIGPNSHTKTSYLAPAAYSFWIWTLIDFLLLGMVIIQFTDAGFGPVVETIGWRFAIIGLLNAAWVYLFHHGQYVIGFVVVLFLAAAISNVYWDLKKNRPTDKISAIFVHLPFSLWHAYAVFLVVLTGFTAFSKDKHSHPASLATKVVGVIALVFLASTSVGYAFESQKGDLAGAAVIAWELLAIYINQPHPRLIHWFALAGFIVSLLAIVKALFYTARNPSLTGDDGERAPLIAGSD